MTRVVSLSPGAVHEASGDDIGLSENRSPEENLGIITSAYQLEIATDMSVATDNLRYRLGTLGGQLRGEAKENDYYSPELVRERLLTGFNDLYRDRHVTRSPAESLDSLVNHNKLSLYNLDNFRAAEIDPYDEMLFLQASVLTAGNRSTALRHKLAQRAASLLKHEATNSFHLPLDSTPLERKVFIERFARGVFALQALRRLQGPQPENITSLDEALTYISEVNRSEESGHMSNDEIPPVEESVSDNESDIRFRPIAPVERSGRLNGLNDMMNMLKDKYGDDVHFNLFETMVFSEKDDTLTPDHGGGQGDSKDRKEREEGDGTGGEDDENDSSNFGSDYTIAEVIHTQPDGQKVVHAIAESPIYGNACYVLRSEVLSEWQELTGIRLNWQDVFRLPKVTARQLGARNFRHYETSDVTGKVTTYLTSEPERLVHDVFNRVFTRLFDADLQPTRANRLPRDVVQALQSSETVRDFLDMILARSYKGASDILRRVAYMDDVPEPADQEEEQGAVIDLAEYERVVVELQRLREEVTELREVRDEVSDLRLKFEGLEGDLTLLHQLRELLGSK